MQVISCEEEDLGGSTKSSGKLLTLKAAAQVSQWCVSV